MKYRKYGFVSNLRKYDMLWLRFATICTDIMYQKAKYQPSTVILRISE